VTFFTNSSAWQQDVDSVPFAPFNRLST